jgi:hypothetical protein
VVPLELADGGQPGPNGELLSCRIREPRAITHSGPRRGSGYLGIEVGGIEIERFFRTAMTIRVAQR